MKDAVYQVITDRVNRRTLKIEATGDFARHKVKLRIRLVGNWLERAGFKPGHRVEVRLDEPGKLTLSFSEQTGQATP